MAPFDLFGSSSGFKGTVEGYCKAIGWKIAEIDNDHAVIKFDMNSGRTQSCLITKSDTNFNFLVVSLFKFDSEDKIPHYLSTVLMKRNAQIMIGKWGVNDVNGTHIFTVGHSVDVGLCNQEFFRKSVLILVKECDDLEGVLLKMINP